MYIYIHFHRLGHMGTFFWFDFLQNKAFVLWMFWMSVFLRIITTAAFFFCGLCTVLFIILKKEEKREHQERVNGLVNIIIIPPSESTSWWHMMARIMHGWWWVHGYTCDAWVVGWVKKEVKRSYDWSDICCFSGGCCCCFYREPFSWCFFNGTRSNQRSIGTGCFSELSFLILIYFICVLLGFHSAPHDTT